MEEVDAEEEEESEEEETEEEEESEEEDAPATIKTLTKRYNAEMSVEFIKRVGACKRTRFWRAGFCLVVVQTVDGETIQRECDWIFYADHFLNCKRRRVIVVVIAAAAVSAKLIKFAN